MQVAIDLPADFVQFQPTEHLQAEIRASYALWLYQRGRVTLVRAAQLAGLDAYEFMALCKLNRVAVIDLTRDDLLEDLAGFVSA
jgi:predicted HTH domain antitoxin